MNVTPVILTQNEEQNIRETLAALDWAKRIVVVDGGSTDATERIARSFGNTDWFQRPFDTHGAQWRFGIFETSIDSDYILALDADMRPGPGFAEELRTFLTGAYDGAWISFDYRILGRNLTGSIYPPQSRLFKKSKLLVEQPGHTQVFVVSGSLYRFTARLIHDDKKPLRQWLSSQLKYAQLEANRINATSRVGLKDRLRLLGLSPVIWWLYAYIKAGGPWNSPASTAYAYERLIFESILARVLCEQSRLRC